MDATFDRVGRVLGRVEFGNSFLSNIVFGQSIVFERFVEALSDDRLFLSSFFL